MPAHTTASCFVKVPVSLLTVCVVAVRSHPDFNKP